MSFFEQLKQRNVIRVGIAYLAFGWLLVEVSNTILPMFDFGPGVPRLIVLVLAIGFIPTLIFAWAVEITPEGLKLDHDGDRSAVQVARGGSTLDRVVIAVLALALAWFAFDKFLITPKRETVAVEAARQQAASEALEQAKIEAYGQSIAVMPFANASGDAGNDYISNGISDELRDRLAQLPDTRVMARSSSMRIGEQNLGLADIATQFGVSRVIEGRFNRQETRVVVSVELIDAVSGFQIWSQTYERASHDLLSLQQDLARAVVDRLMPELNNDDEAMPPSAQQVSAYDLLLLGRQYEQRVTDQQLVDEANLQLAIDYYKKVITEDPQSAEAHARLGKMLLYRRDINAAKESILTALELDPQLSDAHTTLGLFYYATRQDGIGAAFLRAVELNPNNADALSYYASWLWLQSKVDESVDYYRQARDVDPISLVRHADLGYILGFQVYREEAQVVNSRILQLFPTAPGYLAAARIAEAYGAPDEAIAYALEARSLRPDDPDIAGQLAEMYARIGDFEQAQLYEPEPGMGQLFWQRRYDELIDLGEELAIDRPGDTDVLYTLAFAYNATGRFEDSLRALEFAGLPYAAMSEARRANDLHALMTMAGALDAIGDREHANLIADIGLNQNQTFIARTGKKNWIEQQAGACYRAAKGEDEEALSWLEKMSGVDGARWMPWLKDHACFRNFAEEPRYLAVVAAHEQRFATIRKQLPQFLEERGLSPIQPDQK